MATALYILKLYQYVVVSFFLRKFIIIFLNCSHSWLYFLPIWQACSSTHLASRTRDWVVTVAYVFATFLQYSKKESRFSSWDEYYYLWRFCSWKSLLLTAFMKFIFGSRVPYSCAALIWKCSIQKILLSKFISLCYKN